VNVFEQRHRNSPEHKVQASRVTGNPGQA
jgi:hypothetical protein